MKKKRLLAVLVVMAFLAVTLLRVFYAQCLVACYTPNAPHDETMQFVKSICVSNGEWMGEYNNLTLIKGCFFPVFSGTVYALSLNYVQVLQFFFIAACLFCVASFFPLFRNWKTALVVYLLLLFNPISTSNVSSLTYRASLYYILVLFFVSGLCGAALRYSEKSGKGRCFLLVGALFYGLAANTREDSQWLTLFFAVFLLVYVIFAFVSFGKKGGVQSVISLLLVIAIASAPSFCIAWKNYDAYGVFLTEDYNSGSFAQAYTALRRPISQNNDRAHYPIPEDIREQVYAVSESFAKLEPYLEEDPRVTAWKAYGGANDYANGWVTYALRDAAAAAGFYETAQTAQEFWSQVEREVNAACDSGEIVAQKRSVFGLAAQLKSEYLPEVLRRTLSAVKIAACCEYVTPLLEYIELDKAHIDSIEAIMGCKINASYRNENDLLLSQVDLNSVGYNRIVAVNSVYHGIFFYVFLLGSTVFLAAAISVIFNMMKKGSADMERLSEVIVVGGIFLLLLTRCFMMAYMDYTAYSTLTRPLYMSDSFVIAELFSLIALSYGIRILAETKQQISLEERTRRTE